MIKSKGRNTDELLCFEGKNPHSVTERSRRSPKFYFDQDSETISGVRSDRENTQNRWVGDKEMAQNQDAIVKRG